ncbi:MAG: alanine racemase, partial [Chlamydiota bacterium]|nr:alanine racemase [Chlamydiota bacterium]
MQGSDIKNNIKLIRNRIRESCQKVDRDPSSVEIVAVTKYVNAKRIKEAWDEGIRIFSENYIQEAESKIAHIDFPVRWHLTGHLQKNKVQKAIQIFNMIQSVDSVALAQLMNDRLEKCATLRSGSLPVLLEMRVRGEDAKYGFDEDALEEAYLMI